jgi:hypothetical protein
MVIIILIAIVLIVLALRPWWKRQMRDAKLRTLIKISEQGEKERNSNLG